MRRAGGDSSSEDEEEVPLLDSEGTSTRVDNWLATYQSLPIVFVNLPLIIGQSSSSNESGVESHENTVQSEDTSSPLSRLLGGKKKKTEFDISLPARHLVRGFPQIFSSLQFNVG